MPAPAEQDRVVPIPVPDPDVVQPLPIILAKDGALVLSYMAFVGRKDQHIVVTFHVAYAHRFTPIDKKGLAAHPLAARGLKADGAFEVKGSSWAPGGCGPHAKHYVFSFKDALFECLADGFGSETIEEDDDVVRLMSRRLYR